MLLDFILYATTIVLLFRVIYKWATKSHNYFAKRNMEHLKPTLFGNTMALYLNRQPAHKFMEKIYYSHPNEKYIATIHSSPISFFSFKTLKIKLPIVISLTQG